MRPTIPVFLSLILLAGLLPASAEAQFKCVKMELVNCRCRTPYRIRCVNAEGYVRWNISMWLVGVVIKDDRGRIKDTFSLGSSSLKDFNLHTIHEGDAFKEKLESIGRLPRGHSYEIRDFWLSSTALMYDGPDMEDRKGTIAEVNRRMRPPDRCFYTKRPTAVDIGSDGYSTTVCVGEVQCSPRSGGSEYVTLAICLAPGIQGDVGSCPDATSCLAEEVPEIRPFLPVPRSSR